MVLVLIAGFSLCAGVQADEKVVIFPREKGVQINRFFYDFKSPSAPRMFLRDDWAKTLLVDYDFSGIRTSIYGTSIKPAHPSPGTVLEKYYKEEIAGLKLAKKIRPDTLIFASKKLYKKESFPAWTKDDDDGVVPKQYAILLFDYLNFMKDQGLEVDVLGIDNERGFNEGNIMPGKHRAIVVELRRLTRAGDVQMPKMIGHEDIGMARDDWMKQFEKVGGDTLDIFGAHYYPHWRHVKRMKEDLEYAGTREKWHTELHLDRKPGDDPLLQTTKAYLALWDCTDHGMNGFMWWAFNPKKNIYDHLMHAATVPLVNAWPVKVTDPDGSETTNEMQLHTRAFQQGNTLTIYALNLDASKEWKDLDFKLATGHIVGMIDGRRWADGFPDEGETAKIKPNSNNAFCVDIAPHTINIFTMRLKP